MSLDVEQLYFSYGNRTILQDVSFRVAPGEFTAVIGPNGVGKSTLFRCILGILDGFNGKISAAGCDIRQMSRRQMAERIAYIPQIHRPTFGYSVLDTVLMGTTRFLSPMEVPKAEHIMKAQAALEQVGIRNMETEDFTRLSGGQQQLVLIARALVQDARLLIMDEPTSALDYGNQMKVLKLVKELTASGYSVVISTHNPQHAISFADKVLALMPDRSSSFGQASEVMTRELIERLYGIAVDFIELDGETVLMPRCREVWQSV